MALPSGMDNKKRGFFPGFSIFLVLLPLLGAVVGSGSLLLSPYTGMSLETRDGGWVVAEATTGTPSESLLPWVGRPVTSLAGQVLMRDSLATDPDEIRNANDLEAFWRFQQALSDAVVPHRPFDITINTPLGPKTITMNPVPFPAAQIVERYGPYLVFGFFPLFLGLVLITKRPDDERAQSFFYLGLWVALFAVSYGATAARETAFPFAIQTLGRLLNAVVAPMAYLGALHFGLVFPRRRKLLDWRPLPWVLAGLLTVVIVLFQTRLSYDARLAFFLFCRVGGGLLILQAYLTSRSSLERTQTLWVIVAIGFSGLPFLFATLGRLLGWGDFAVGLGVPVFFFLGLPIAILIAVSRYRLMEIDAFFDNLLIYVPTLCVLAVLDWALISWLGGVIPASGTAGTTLITALTLWITLVLYLPLRKRVSQMADRLLGRNPLVFDDVLLRFADRLLTTRPGEVLAEGGAFVASLWGSSTETRLASEPSPMHPWAANLSIARHLYEIANAPFSEGSLPALLVPIVGASGYLGYWQISPRSSRKLFSRREIQLSQAMAKIAGKAYEVHLAQEENLQQKARLSRELHDGVGSSVSNAVLSLNLLLRERVTFPPGSPGRARLETLRDSLASNLSEVRDLVWGLEENEATIEALADHWREKTSRFFRSTGISHSTQIVTEDPGRRISQSLRIAVIRITQECLTNVLVHSGASTVGLSFRTDKSKLTLVISDNGVGFTVPRSKQGYGLRNMEARAQEQGGTLEIESTPGEGTKVSLSMPLSPGS